MQEAIGLVETRGLVALVEATDAMAKAANVKITKRIQIGGAYMTTIVSGDVGSVRAAVEAGARSPTVLSRPRTQLISLVLASTSAARALIAVRAPLLLGPRCLTGDSMLGLK